MLKQILILFLGILFFRPAYVQGLVLTSNGKSNYSIIVPVTANGIELKAARALQDYLTQISGCTLPIINTERASSSYQIIIGRTKKTLASDVAGLGNDGILIKQTQNTLILTGGVNKGVLFSVYTLLEEYLGCQAYTATDIFIPTKTTIKLPANLYRKEMPTFSYRMAYSTDAFNHAYCDWRRLNYFKEGWGLWVHSFEDLVPKEKYFRNNPQYFALINGERNPAQLDLTNSDVLRIVVENLGDMMKANPEAKYWSVSQNDNPGYCECKNCRKLNIEQESPQGSLLTFVNEVAKHFPEVTIATLAYNYSENPPKTLKPGKNVMIMLATGSEDRSTPISENPKGNFVRNIKNWSKVTSELFLWNYIVNFEHAFFPFPNLTVLQPNTRFFASQNVSYMFEQGIGELPAEFSELKTYVVSKLMWNKDVNVTSIINQFSKYYYGKEGGKYILDYINLLHANARKVKLPLASQGLAKGSFKSYLSGSNIKTYKSLFENAFKVVDRNSVYGKRILREYLSVLYAELEYNRQNISAGNGTNISNKRIDRNLLEQWHKYSKEVNIIYLNDSRRPVENYYKEYLEILNKK